MKFDKIGFIGLGLIGGSIAKKIKKDTPATHIIATSHHARTVVEAHNEGLIENDTLLPLSAFGDCDLIFLCAPVEHNISYLEQLKDIIKPGCYITDVGSTKAKIHEKVSELGMEASFIGGHPMTGSEKTGILASNEALLENAYYIITPTAVTPKEDVEEFREFVASLGSIPLILDCKKHDYATGAISHLPHMMAYTLVNLVQDIDDEQEIMKTIAAGGFRDITRVASSSPVMWENICASNRKPILDLIDQYVGLLTELKGHIESSDKQYLLDFFQKSKDYRDSMNLPSVKSPNKYYELFVDIEDKAGGLAAVTRILADRAINIKNLSIINNREYEDGVLLLAFKDDASRTESERVLTEEKYTVYRRQ